PAFAGMTIKSNLGLAQIGFAPLECKTLAGYESGKGSEKRRRTRLVFARQGDVAWQGLVRSGAVRDISAGPFGAFMDSLGWRAGRPGRRAVFGSVVFGTTRSFHGVRRTRRRRTCRSLDTRQSSWRTRRFASG